MIKKLSIDNITTDGMQVRLQTNPETVDQYAADMENGDTFPPIKVFTDGKVNLCPDGLHRIMAAVKCGKKQIDCDIAKGGRAAAITFALGCNTAHGLRRTNEDKRHAVEIASKEFQEMSDRSIAGICKVSNTFVGTIRPAIQAELDSAKQLAEQAKEAAKVDSGVNVDTSKPKPAPKPAPKRIGRDGKKYSAPPEKPSAKPDAKKDKKETDETGLEIPAALMKTWLYGAESEEIIREMNGMKKIISRCQEKAHPIFAHVDFTDILSRLEMATEGMKAAIPHAVCHKCGGKDADLTKECKTCLGSGFLPKIKWDRVDDETKKVSGRK